MGHSHGGAAADRSPKRGRRLLIALALNLGITIAELVGGVISGSLALLADAAHNFSDAGSILVSYIAWRISQRQADRSRTFGYARAETVGALVYGVPPLQASHFARWAAAWPSRRSPTAAMNLRWWPRS